MDGVCSTAILVRALRALGADPTWEIPSRFDDGYGLSVATVERLAASGVGLLVTVDCGITAVAEVAAARAAGHGRGRDRPPPARPGAARLPDRAPGARATTRAPSCARPGVALKLSEGLRSAAGRDPAEADEDLDLAALATVCDIVPLRDENRRIVREGVARAGARPASPGLRALMEVASVDPATVGEQALGFRLGPRINAAGRMQRAAAALELLLTEDADRAAEVARELDLLNRDRREAETRILFAAEGACAPQAHRRRDRGGGRGLAPGRGGDRGLAAGGALAPAVRGDRPGRRARAAARAAASRPTTFTRACGACSEHLTRFGGHRMAAGVELRGGGARALPARAGRARRARR